MFSFFNHVSAFTATSLPIFPLPQHLAHSPQRERQVFHSRDHLLFIAILEIPVDTFGAFFICLDTFPVEILKGVPDRLCDLLRACSGILLNGRGTGSVSAPWLFGGLFCVGLNLLPILLRLKADDLAAAVVFVFIHRHKTDSQLLSACIKVKTGSLYYKYNIYYIVTSIIIADKK